MFTKASKLERKQDRVKNAEANSKQASNARQISINAGNGFVQELNQGFSKNKSQYFGGKLTAPNQTLQTNLLHSQRMVLNAIRKGPSFAGMSEIATPQGAQESGKVTA